MSRGLGPPRVYSLLIPSVEAKFRRQRGGLIIAAVGTIGLVALFAYVATYPAGLTTSQSPTRASVTAVATLFIVILLALTTLLLSVTLPDFKPRPAELRVDDSGVTILDVRGGERSWEFEGAALQLELFENLSTAWTQPVAGLAKPRFPRTFMPPEALAEICRCAEAVGLVVQRSSMGPQSYRVRFVTPAFRPPSSTR